MTDTGADLEAALDRVVEAARAHLTAVRVAEGAPDDETVWQAYVALNNAAHDYDEALNEVYGEVTPWDLQAITEAEGRVPALTSLAPGGPVVDDDPHPPVVSVRQRRDYRVPSVSALLRAAEATREPGGADAPPDAPLRTVTEAVLELLQAGDGSLGMLDVPELEPLDGLVVIAEVAEALDPGAHPHTDGEAPFRLGDADRAVGRLDERAGPEPVE
jgi:hypothetical protein